MAQDATQEQEGQEGQEPRAVGYIEVEMDETLCDALKFALEFKRLAAHDITDAEVDEAWEEKPTRELEVTLAQIASAMAVLTGVGEILVAYLAVNRGVGFSHVEVLDLDDPDAGIPPTAD